MSKRKWIRFRTLFVAPLLVVLAAWLINLFYDSWRATPALNYQATKLGLGFADIELKSGSTEPFLLQGVLYRITAILRPPAANKPAPPPAPVPIRPWLRRQTKPGSAVCGAAISPDDVSVNPGQPIINHWYSGERIFNEVEPHKGELIHFQIRDPAAIGARYRVEVAMVFGDADHPRTECVPQFDIDVTAQ